MEKLYEAIAWVAAYVVDGFVGYRLWRVRRHLHKAIFWHPETDPIFQTSRDILTMHVFGYYQDISFEDLEDLEAIRDSLLDVYDIPGQEVSEWSDLTKTMH